MNRYFFIGIAVAIAIGFGVSALIDLTDGEFDLPAVHADEPLSP